MKPSSPFVFYIFLMAFIGFSCDEKPDSKRLKEFIDAHTEQLIPLQEKVQKAEFNAAVSGKTQDYQQAAELNIQLAHLYCNAEDYNVLKEIKQSESINDPVLKRQLNVLLNKYSHHQTAKESLANMIKRASDIRMKFSTYRPELGDTTLSLLQVEKLLEQSRDTRVLEEVWKASKQVGVLVANDFIRLAKKRNKAARDMGYSNYHSMMLKVNEQDPAHIEHLFNKMKQITEEPYRQIKQDIDSSLAVRYNIQPEALRPWHYQNQYFQTAPDILNTDFSPYYSDVDIVEMASQFYQSIGLGVNGILAQSDLESKPGKRQHASTFPINRKGDVRIIGNVANNAYSMNRLLYELGFALYHKHVSDSLPYLLKKPAHFALNDAIAIMFSNFSFVPEWLESITGNAPDRQISPNSDFLNMEKLVFARWSMVMYHFEKGLYENPDRDLNTFWYDLVEKYQLLNRPENRNKPDWAAKSHFFTMPCKYHNYLLGDLLAAQLCHHINNHLLESCNSPAGWTGNEAIGNFLIDSLFSKGSRYNYHQLIKQVTEEPLSTQYFQSHYIN